MSLAYLPDNTALLLGEFNPPHPPELSEGYWKKPVGGGREWVPGPPGCTYPMKRMTAFSRFTYCNGEMKMFGFGHAESCCDWVMGMNMSAETLAWTPDYAPTPVSQLKLENYSVANAGFTVDGVWRPMCRHTYDLMPFAENTGELILLMEISVAIKPYCVDPTISASPPGKIAHYNVATKQWRASAASKLWPLNQMVSGKYDPVSGKIIVIGRNGNYTYDPVTEICTRHTAPTYSQPLMSNSQNLVYFPPNDKFYYMQNDGSAFEVTLDRANFANTTVVYIEGITGDLPPLPLPTAQNSEGETGWAYDSVNQIIGGGIVNGLFHAFDPITKVWTAQTIEQDPYVRDVGKLAFHCIDYDPVNNVFIFIDRVPIGGGSIDSYTWAYRYRNPQ